MHRIVRWSIAVGLGMALGAGSARADTPVDPLYGLVPADADVVIATERLDEQVRALRDSPMVAALAKLPAVADWLGSEPVRGVKKVGQQVEQALGVDVGTIREQILGDTTILAVRVGPPDAADAPRGVMVGKARDRALLARLIQTVNDAQRDGGELRRVEPRRVGTAEYFRREMAVPGRPDEFYATFEDGVFAWSNSEDLLRGVIGRKAGERGSLAEVAEFRATRPESDPPALLSLFVSSRAVGRTLEAGGLTPDHAPNRVAAAIARQAAALRAVGVAVEVRSGVAIRVHQTLDPARLDGWARDELLRLTRGQPGGPKLPPAAVMAARFDLDFVAIHAAVTSLIADKDRAWYQTLDQAARGLLLGQRLEADILPRLGPGLLFWIGEPVATTGGKSRVPVVAELAVSPGPESPGPGAAIENALRTTLAMYALDAAQARQALRVETIAVGSTSVLVLSSVRRVVLAYASGPDRIALGNVPEAVIRPEIKASSPATLEAIRAAEIPDARWFAVVDLDRLARLIEARRGPIAERLAGRGPRRPAEIGRDLDAIGSAARVFRAGYLRVTPTADATAIRAEARLIAR